MKFEFSNLKRKEIKMKIDKLKRARELMLIETMCIRKANTCDRDCKNCELVQKIGRAHV